jgi:hypothetical protein
VAQALETSAGALEARSAPPDTVALDHVRARDRHALEA